MALNVTALNTELASAKAALEFSWGDLAIYIKGKIAEAVINGGITNYTIAGRSVTVNLEWLNNALKIAESRSIGGLVTQTGEF